MRKDKLLKEWYDFNIKYWKALKLRAKLHGHLENSEALPQHIFDESEPIFVLSTGRVGTMLLTRLFELEKGLHIEHEALPEMLLTSKTAYVTRDISFAKGAFLAGRYEAIRDYQLSGLRYVETNNRLTFFAPAIAELFPKAKFIHLVRHPSSFISSGMQRKWYTGQSITDEGRISPPESLNLMSRSDKIAWLWNTTNEYIENFKRSISVERVYTLQAEKLFTNVDEAISLMKWLKFQTQPDLAKKIIDTPVNKSKTKKKYHSYDKSLTPLSKLYYPESDSNRK